MGKRYIEKKRSKYYKLNGERQQASHEKVVKLIKIYEVINLIKVHSHTRARLSGHFDSIFTMAIRDMMAICLESKLLILFAADLSVYISHLQSTENEIEKN